MMKIIKIKILKNKIKITLDNKETLEIDKELYTNFYLYENKELSNKEYKQIKEENDVASLLKYALRIRSKAIYTEYQIREKLYQKDASKPQVDKVINSLKKYDLIDDDAYIEDYVEYCNSLNMGENKIRNKLLDKGIFSNKLDKIKFPISIEKRKAKNNFPKLDKKYDKYNFTQKKQHIYNAYISLGFNNDIASEMTSLIKEDKNNKEELNKLKKDYEKVYMRLSRKYDKKELRQRVLSSLVSKGYKMNDVINLLSKEKL